ncbi:polysaccharide biosynthesis/export family protein [Aequorivita viscosa]|uniref:Protein involved in gliding motility EpsA n=1 Tax=Aequorivita viscosa TaxID=797419 RepID=A0A1M6B6A8_9FLAO|nr:polysaccharide biosynthesis/export family protein [Aequorivita viscosa]SDW33638.1 protein involved in gliding motility EpsA [Aequorivita viscosa]SHI44271.1 protein involved in gliding motility EpsA [Aequorivita viscosa]
MKFIYPFLFLFVVITVSSCVSRKQLTYLQENASDTDTLAIMKKRQEPYRLQINDLLSIRVKTLDQEFVGIFNPISDANPNATGEERLYYDGFVVNDHGNIRIPSMGEVNVLGYTVDEVREMLEDRLLKDYFKEEANVFVTVKLAGIRYTINGEIGKPGSQIIYRDQVSIMEAIANSGDITITGDRKDVVIIRQYPAGQKVHHIDLTQLEAMNSPYYYVKPNDLILINPLPQKSWGTGTTGLQSITTVATIIAALSTTLLLITRL